MQILIAGGCGFVGSYLAERFLKEGHEVVIVDRAFTGRENSSSRRFFYEMDVAEQHCEEIFRVHNIDIVICAIGDAAAKWRSLSAEAHCAAVMHLLALTERYGVKQFIYLSSDAALREAEDVTALADQMAEACCLRWKACHSSALVIVRLAALYGAGQRESQGVVAAAVAALARKEMVVVLESEKTRGDLLYVEDAVDAICRLTQRPYAFDVLEVGSGESVCMQELGAVLQTLASAEIAFAEGKAECFCQTLSVQRCEAELGWRRKYTLQEGLQKTYQLCLAAQSAPAARSGEKKGSWWKPLRPYVENLFLFAICAALALNSPQKSVVDSNVGLDYNYVYIMVMGLLYGKQQSFPAMFLSVGLLIYSFAARGADLVAFIYQSQHIMHLATYLLIGVLVGYVTDNKNRAFADMHMAKERVQERYGFLEQMYLKNNEIKERLYRQIVNSDDSLGRTYKILQKLDGIEVENIFTAANSVVAEMLGVDNVAIYVLGRDRYYLRLKTRIGRYTETIPNSLQVEAHAYLQQMLEDRQVFVNRLLTPGLPDMAAPIFYDNGVIAVLQVYHLGFENMNLNRQNQLRITAMLISGALSKAYRYEDSQQEKRYVKDTQFLIAAEFQKVCQEMRAREKQQSGGFVLLLLEQEGADLPQLSAQLIPLIRNEDYMGLDADGRVRILLLHIKTDALEIVRRRFADAGFKVRLIEGGGNGE